MAEPTTGRAPYYRIGSGLGIFGAFCTGAALAGWGTLSEIWTRPPQGWTSVLLLAGGFGLVGAAAIAAGRAPFEVGVGKGGGNLGRPAWAISLALHVFGTLVGMIAIIPLIDRGPRAAVFVAAGLWVCAAFGAGFFVFDLWKQRAPLGFGLGLVTAGGVTGTVVEGRLERRILHTHKAKLYRTRSTTWIDAHASVDGTATLRVRTGGTDTDVATGTLRWSAPIRYLPGGEARELTSVTTILAGDHILHAPDRNLAFAAAGSPRLALALATCGHLARLTWLLALSVTSAVLAAHLQ